MKIALYARVSKALDQTPENQLLELRRWADAYGHEVEGEYVDEISSKDTRPQKEAVLRKLRRGNVAGVAFWTLDRWGRSMGELVLEIEEFQQRGIIMFSMKEGLDFSTAGGRMQAHIYAAFANFERDRNQERTLLGLARARAQGKRLGRPRKCQYCKLPLWGKKRPLCKKAPRGCIEKTPPAEAPDFIDGNAPQSKNDRFPEGQA